MLAKANLPKLSIEQMVDRIFAFRQITRVDQQLLMKTLLSKHSLSETEQGYINRVFDAVQRGTVRVVE